MAGDFFSFRLEGARELEKALEQLPKAVAKTVLKKAAIKALAPVLAAAEANASSKVGRVTGRFAGSFKITTNLSKRQKREARRKGGLGNVDVYVGSDDPKAHLIEFGTSKMGPRPILRPAWDEKKNEAFEIFQKEVAAELEKAAANLAKKAIKGTLSKGQMEALR